MKLYSSYLDFVPHAEHVTRFQSDRTLCASDPFLRVNLEHLAVAHCVWIAHNASCILSAMCCYCYCVHIGR